MKRFFRSIVSLQCMILCIVMFVYSINAQDTLPRSTEIRKKLFLSLEETINLALQNNLEIRIEQYNPEIRKEAIKNAEAAFDSSVSAGSSQTFSESLSPTSPKGDTSIETGIGKRFKTGGAYQLGVTTSRSTFDDDIDDAYATGLQLQLSQALLKNRGIDVNTTQISVAGKNRDISVSELRAKVIDIVSQVKNTYWNLIFALGDLEAKRLSLQLAYDLVKINEAQVNVGTLAPIEVLQAKATAASREVDIISAEQTVRDVEDELRRLLNIPENDPAWVAAIIPTDTPLSALQPVSLEESIQLALKNREELLQLQKSIEIQELLLNSAKNQLLPELGIQGNVGLNGEEDNWGGSMSNLVEFDTYAFTIGVNFSYPLGNNAAESSYNETKLGLDQTKLSLRNLEQLVTVQVREAVRSVETAYKLVEATKIALQLAQEQLDAEQKKFNEGLSTNFQVLDYQDKLASARSRQTQAITSYNQALVALEQLTGVTLQRHNIVIKE